MNLIDQITQDLSLRAPQKAALAHLDTVLSNIMRSIPNLQEASLQEIEDVVMIGNFERFDTPFPSFCFHIATGVGKTLLMAASIVYLYRTQKWRNFFILTKGSTIYEKTIANFSQGNPKCVLTGYTDLPEYELITGENYSRQLVGDLLSRSQSPLSEEFINIFVFNVEKLFDNTNNTNEKRRFHDEDENLGGSLAELLAEQKDLVLLMDESHRYRATASMAAMEALQPILGLEFTATPSGRNKNIIYRYDLARAVRDALNQLESPSRHSGFIKVPVVLGRQDMHATGDVFEEIQLQDGISRHRQKKTLLEAYCKNHNLPRVLPIVLISTRNIEHANNIRSRIESDDFFDGEYKDKTIVTHSRTGELREDDLTGLLNLESPCNEKEIVIHVNRLREGWDVKNVYTIIPLRAHESEVLTEQTIGRGLRLPFGKQTGDEELDTLEIAAHDHFASIVRAAQNNMLRTGIPFYTREVTDSDKAEVEARIITPSTSSPYEIKVPKLALTYNSEGRLHDFEIAPRREFTRISPALIANILGENTYRTLDIPADIMDEDPVRFLVRNIFDKCSSISPNDANDTTLVPQLILRYLSKIDSDPQTWKESIQNHGTEMINDLIKQIQEHVVKNTKVEWKPTGEILVWRDWARRVPKGYMAPRFDAVRDAECTKRLLTGYQKTIYRDADFDTLQEKYLADILERDSAIRAWVRIPIDQLKIFYAPSNYNPDFLSDDGKTIYILEVKNSAELDDKTVERKAAAAKAWCEAATKLGGREWIYKLLPHDAILPTDSFKGAISKAYKPPLAFPQVESITNESLRERIEKALTYLNEEEVHIGLYLLSKEFEGSLKSYLIAANAKGKLSSTPGNNSKKWMLANMVDCATANGIFADKPALQYLKEVRNAQAHGPAPSFEERIVLMSSAEHLANLYIGYTKLLDNLLNDT